LEFISEKKLFPELEYIFKHALTQEVAYNSLLLNRRKEIHEKIGNAIETLYPERLEEYYELLAYHYEHSNNLEKAAEYLTRANEKAAKLNAMQEAKTFLYAAMKLLETLPDTVINRERRISLLMKQWPVFLLLIELPEYYELLIQYKSVAVDLEKPELLGTFYGRVANCEWSFGYYDQAIETATKALQLCTAAENYEDAGFAYGALLWSHMCKGNYDNVFALWDDVQRLPKQSADPRGYGGISWAYTHLGRWDEAVEMGRKALRAAEEMSNNSLVSFAAWIISIAYTSKGDYNQGVEYGELAVQKAPTLADRLWAQGFLAWAFCRSGELNKGIETLNKILPAFTAGHFRFGEIGYRLTLGEGYWLSGEYEKATQTLDEALELAELSAMKYYMGWAHRLLGEVGLETNPDQAPPHFEQSITIFREINAQNDLALAYAGCGRLHKQHGNIGQARDYLTNALEIFERLGTLIEPDKVRKEVAELPKE
jgi:tetratricopeptide (TPR) repeat protein